MVERSLHVRMDLVHVVLGQMAVGRGRNSCEKRLMYPTTRGGALFADSSVETVPGRSIAPILMGSTMPS